MFHFNSRVTVFMLLSWMSTPNNKDISIRFFFIFWQFSFTLSKYARNRLRWSSYLNIFSNFLSNVLTWSLTCGFVLVKSQSYLLTTTKVWIGLNLTKKFRFEIVFFSNLILANVCLACNKIFHFIAFDCKLRMQQHATYCWSATWTGSHVKCFCATKTFSFYCFQCFFCIIAATFAAICSVIA